MHLDFRKNTEQPALMEWSIGVLHLQLRLFHFYLGGPCRKPPSFSKQTNIYFLTLDIIPSGI